MTFTYNGQHEEPKSKRSPRKGTIPISRALTLEMVSVYPDTPVEASFKVTLPAGDSMNGLFDIIKSAMMDKGTLSLSLTGTKKDGSVASSFAIAVEPRLRSMEVSTDYTDWEMF